MLNFELNAIAGIRADSELLGFFKLSLQCFNLRSIVIVDSDDEVRNIINTSSI